MQRANDEVRPNPLEEGHDKACGVEATRLQPDKRHGHAKAGDELRKQLLAAGETKVPLVNDLDVVVSEADRRQRQDYLESTIRAFDGDFRDNILNLLPSFRGAPMLPPNTITMDITDAKIGLLMKKRENTG